MKIIAVPGAAFAAAYATWHEDAGVFDVHLATSLDLVTWTWRARLGSEASQPTIRAASDGGYVVAWEVTPLEFNCEGTVNLYSASSTLVDAGFHYLANGVVDRQARGTMDWTSWTAAKDVRLDAALTSLGVKGNIGDRDTIRFRSLDFMLLEGQLAIDDLASERIFLVDLASGVAEQLDFRTADGSTSVSNPTVELVELGGRQALVFGAYVFSDTAQGGPMIWYRVLDGG